MLEKTVLEGGGHTQQREPVCKQGTEGVTAKPGLYCKNSLNREKIGACATGTQKLEEQEEPRVHVRQQ